MRPNFLYIGPDKSGSSWLFNVLLHHPDCYVPDCKDIYFFDNYYHRGLDWYLSFFSECSGAKRAIGEISHGYLYSEEAPGRIIGNFPDIKIITTLRNPVERSISHYFYLKSSGLISCDLHEAVKIRPGIINSSLYYECIKRYMETFPKDQLKINLFDDLCADAHGFAQDIFDFLGLPEMQDFDYSQRVREARKPKNFHLAKLLKLAALKARDMGFGKIVGKIKNSKSVNMLYQPLEKGEKEKVSEEAKEWLGELFREDTLRLGELLGRDFDHWLVAGK